MDQVRIEMTGGSSAVPVDALTNPPSGEGMRKGAGLELLKDERMKTDTYRNFWANSSVSSLRSSSCSGLISSGKRVSMDRESSVKRVDACE